MNERTKDYAAERLLEFILKNFGRGEVFTYSDLPSVKELSPRFFEEYKKRYEAAEASGIVMLSSVEEMAMGELLQTLEEVEIEVVGPEQFKLKHPRPAPTPPAPPPTPPTKKYCIYCGVVIPPEAVYCPHCGGKQD